MASVLMDSNECPSLFVHCNVKIKHSAVNHMTKFTSRFLLVTSSVSAAAQEYSSFYTENKGAFMQDILEQL